MSERSPVRLTASGTRVDQAFGTGTLRGV